MEEFVGSVLSKECYQKIFLEGNLFYGPCISLIISKGLSYAILLGGVFLKVPQILKILQAKTAQGLSVMSVMLELIGYLFTLSYSYRRGFPFSTYGELTFISIQNVIILFLIFYYGRGLNPQFFGLVGGYLVLVYLFLQNPGDVVSISVLASLQALNIPIFIASRIPQIWANFTAKSTGQLAFATWILNFAGSAARVFTTMKETGDTLLLTAYLLGVVLNGTICGQILYYGSAPPAKDKKKQ